MRRLKQRCPLLRMIGQQPSRLGHVTGIQRVDPRQPVTNPHHLAPKRTHDIAIVRLDISDHHGVDAAIGQPQHDPPI